MAWVTCVIFLTVAFALPELFFFAITAVVSKALGLFDGVR
jgi:hypothetical protein